MDETNSDRPAGDRANGDDAKFHSGKSNPSHDPKCSIHTAQNHNPGHQQGWYVPKRRRRKWESYQRQFKRAGADRHIELVIAAAVLVLVILQYCSTVSNNQSTSQQTDQLIAAAKYGAYASNQNATAAQSFAESARKINGGINDAVGKLQTQADRLEASRITSEAASRQALQAAIDNFHQEQRAWVGIEVVPADSPEIVNFHGPLKIFSGGAGSPITLGGVTVSGGSRTPDEIVIVAHNTGRTPAVMLRVVCCNYKETENSEVAPDFDALEDDKRSKFIAHAHERRDMMIKQDPSHAEQITKFWESSVLPRELQEFEQSEQYTMKTEEVIPPNGLKPFRLGIAARKMEYEYAVGKFLYRDVFDRQHDHVTKFCVVKYSGLPLHLCDTGQDMN